MAPNAPRTPLPTMVPSVLRDEDAAVEESAPKPVADAEEAEAMPVAEEEAEVVEAENEGMML